MPGTHWQLPTGVLTPHHVGVWCDDLVGSSQTLSADGVEMVATSSAPGRAVTGFAYHRLASGMFLELLDAAREPAFEAWFAGGPHPGAAVQPSAGGN